MTTTTGPLGHLRYQVLVTGAIFFGLFFIEYPPLFTLGYWAWPYTVGYTAHKILSGLFILLNLGITQYVVRRLGFFQKRSQRTESESAVVLSDGINGSSDDA